MATATVTLSLPDGFNRSDDPLHLDRSVIDEVEFDADQCSFYEALGDAGYVHLVHANWIQESRTEYRVVVDGRIIYVAEVVQ